MQEHSSTDGSSTITKKPSKHRLIKGVVICLSILFIGWLLSWSPDVRQVWVWCLAKIGTPAVPLLRRTIDDEHSLVKQDAQIALRDMGVRAVPSLLGTLTHRNADIRRQSARCLSFVGREAGETVPALKEALQDSEAPVRLEAIKALWCIGPASKNAIPDIIRALKDPDGPVRSEAAVALWRMGADPADVVPPLTEALEEKDSRVRLQIVEALSRVGTKAAIPALKKALDDSDEHIRKEAAEALERIQGEG